MPPLCLACFVAAGISHTFIFFKKSNFFGDFLPSSTNHSVHEGDLSGQIQQKCEPFPLFRVLLTFGPALVGLDVYAYAYLQTLNCLDGVGMNNNLLDRVMGDMKAVYFAVKLTFNIEVVAGNTSHFHLPQIIIHTKLCG